MTYSKSLAAALAFSACAVIAAPAFADPVDDAIGARRGYFKLVGLNFGALAAMAKGDVAYDAAAAATYAGNLDALSSMDLANVFVAGSDNAAKPGDTRALPAIWAADSTVGAKVGGFAAAVDALVAAAPNGLDGLRAAVGATGQTCKACHDDYRAASF